MTSNTLPSPARSSRSPGLPLPDGAARLVPGTTAASWHDWRWQQQHRWTSPGAIADALAAATDGAVVIRESVRRRMEEVARIHPVATTPDYLVRSASLLAGAARRDPILAQVLPDPTEMLDDGVPDPFDEGGLEIAPGVVHRYPDRVLFLLTNYCATLCRHCMRKREWQPRFKRLTDTEVRAAVSAIAARPEVRDVLLSGGDPLHLPTPYLDRVLSQLRAATDLDCLRFGSRVPVTMPQRLDDELLSVLERHAPLYVNTHFNHAEEMTEATREGVRRLGRAGVVVSNQGVLLRGVNDRPEELLALSRALLRAGVRAYYLHQCDPVQGARHFRVGLGRACELVQSLRGRISGLAIPKLVVDLPGGGGKVDAEGSHLLRRGAQAWTYRSPLTGDEIDVDVSEGSFVGVEEWIVEPPR